MGTDYPFLLQEIPPGKVICATAALTEEQKQAMLGANALEFLKASR
jgi:aminocarboxymuconate-semialdehyde decarboxylase